jgi:hypothetical protein
VIRPVLAAAGLAAAAILIPLPLDGRQARAAGPDLTMAVTTTYDVRPEEHRVAVRLDITATSQLVDTVTRRYTIDRAYLAIPAVASNLALSAPTGTPSVAVSARGADAETLLLRFGSPLGSGHSIALTLTFDLADPGGEPDRTLRITPSLVAFQAWAYGTDGVAGSSVRVVFPAGYSVAVDRGPLAGPSTEPDGTLAYEAANLQAPGTFVADVRADRPGDLVAGRRSVGVGDRTVVLVVRAWPDDPTWRARVVDVLSRSLPALRDAIGIDWPLSGELEVRETIDRPGGGGSGEPVTQGAEGFDPATGRLDISYLADASAILHGAAHAWFNGSLVADRWIAEGFADLYAEQAGAAVGIDVVSPVMTPEAAAQAMPLNAWIPGSSGDAYGRAASFAVAREIATRAGATAMADVWTWARRGIRAYQPRGTPTGGDPADAEAGAGPPDWRALLDLIEARTGRSFVGIWRGSVIRASDSALLDARASARAAYDRLVAAAGDWSLPHSIRDAMWAWQFELAESQIRAAMDVLGERADIERATTAAGLTPPASLRRAFEGDDGLTAATAEAITELAVVNAVVETRAARPHVIDPTMGVGLIGADPDGELATADAAFAAGDLDGTLEHLAAARAAWAQAPELGRTRIASATGLGLAIVLMGWLIVATRRRRRVVAHATYQGRRRRR